MLERRSLVERERGLVVVVVLVTEGLEGLRRVLRGFLGNLGVVGVGVELVEGVGVSDLGRRIEEELVGSGGGGGVGLREKEMVVVAMEEKGVGE